MSAMGLHLRRSCRSHCSPRATISFRRWDSYARSYNPAEVVASLRVVTAGGELTLQAASRRLVGGTLYAQLGFFGDEPVENRYRHTVNWKHVELDLDSCPSLADLWQEARGFDGLSFAALPDVPRSLQEGEEDVVAILHARIYEIVFEVVGQTSTLSIEGLDSPISLWVDRAIEVLASCEVR